MLLKISIVYRQNLAPQFQDVHMEDLELSMLDTSILAQIVTPAVLFYDEPTNRAIVLKHAPIKSSPLPWASLAGRIYSELIDAFLEVDQSYDPPAFQSLQLMPV